MVIMLMTATLTTINMASLLITLVAVVYISLETQFVSGLYVVTLCLGK